MDLSTLREKDIRTFPFDKILQVIQALQDVEPLKLSKVDAIEKIGDYLLFISIIIERITNDEFDELNQKGKKSRKNSLLADLQKLLDDFTISFEINQFVKNQTTKINAQINSTLNQVNQQKAELFKQFKKQKKEIEQKVKEEKAEIEKLSQQVDEKISDTEHTILSHVLTLMGVFSAVTIIIMSVVITSSSWLNNADAASAIVAFSIPNLVVLLSVIVLVSIIYLYNNIDVIFRKTTVSNNASSQTEEHSSTDMLQSVVNSDHISQSESSEVTSEASKDSSENQHLTDQPPLRKSKKTNHIFPIVFFSIVLLIIVSLSIVLALFAISYTNPSEKPHMRYIITPSEYRIIEENNCGTTNCKCAEHPKYYEFSFDGINYKIPYEEKYKHEGNLYYCAEHNVLE